ncbi:MAG: hypothetical protein K9K38_15350 [Rhodoferax sp.]|nr:hypothetical protein [Rhodoferax sp.]
MQFKSFVTQVIAIGCSLVALATASDLPKKDFTIELRQVEDNQQPAQTFSTQAAAPLLLAQQVRVRNGERAQARFNLAIPIQWTQRLSSQSSSTAVTRANPNASNVSASGNVGAHAASINAHATDAELNQTIIWMEAGQSFSVTPRWPGGKHAVAVDFEVLSATIDTTAHTGLPHQGRSQTSTTLSVPLGEWITVATSGDTEKTGLYRSAGASTAPRLIQLRVTAH